MSVGSTSCCELPLAGTDTYIRLGDHVLRFESEELGEEFAERARRELRETPELMAEAIGQFRELLKAEPAINYPRDDEEKLKVFLRPCKYYPKSALDKMKKFYRFKIKHPKYSENLLPSLEHRAFDISIVTVLPHRNSGGERILLIEGGRKWDTKACTLIQLFRAVMMILEAALSEPRTQISGVQVIIDMEGLCMQHVWQFTPAFAKHVVDWVQNCIPIRMKGIHIVNQPYLFNMVFALFKPFLDEKIGNRIHFHGSNFSSLHTHLDPAILPRQYQGRLDIPTDQGKSLHKYVSSFEWSYKEKAFHGYSSLKDCS